MRRTPQRKSVVIFVSSVLTILAKVATADLLVVVPDYSNEYTSVAKSIIESVPDHTGQFLRPSDIDGDIRRYELVVSIGSKATEIINEDKRFSSVPVISAFMSRAEYQSKPQRTAVFNDVDPKIHLKLILEMFPDRVPRIGIFVDNVTDYQFESADFNRIGRFFLIQKVLGQGDNPARIIESFVQENELDAFIVLPSSIIYDPHSLTAMLYSLYQHNVATIAYTPKLVEGGIGCVAAAYFDKALVVSEIKSRIQSFYETGVLASQASTPKKAKVVVNERLAKALQIDFSHLMMYGEIHEQ